MMRMAAAIYYMFSFCPGPIKDSLCVGPLAFPNSTLVSVSAYYGHLVEGDIDVLVDALLRSLSWEEASVTPEHVLSPLQEKVYSQACNLDRSISGNHRESHIVLFLLSPLPSVNRGTGIRIQ